jgi:hypothetical protein
LHLLFFDIHYGYEGIAHGYRTINPDRLTVRFILPNR